MLMLMLPVCACQFDIICSGGPPDLFVSSAGSVYAVQSSLVAVVSSGMARFQPHLCEFFLDGGTQRNWVLREKPNVGMMLSKVRFEVGISLKGLIDVRVPT
jgi:hypothetical protein